MGFLKKEDRPRYALKMLRSDQHSVNGNMRWRIGEWNSVSGRLMACANGLHFFVAGISRWSDWSNHMWIAEIDTEHSVMVHDKGYPAEKFVARRARIIKKIRISKTKLAEFVDTHGGWWDGVTIREYNIRITRQAFMRTAYYGNVSMMIRYAKQGMRQPLRMNELGEWLIREYAPELFE